MEDENIELKIAILNDKVYCYLKLKANQNISLKELRKNSKKEITDDYNFLDNGDEINPEFEEDRTIEDIMEDETNKNSQNKKKIFRIYIKKIKSEEILSQKKELPNEIDGKDEVENNTFTKFQNSKFGDEGTNKSDSVIRPEQNIKVSEPLLNKTKGGNELEQYFKVNGNEDINELLVNNKINVKKEEEEKEKEKKRKEEEKKKRNEEEKQIKEYKEREENENRILQKFPLGISQESFADACIKIYDIRCPKKEGFKFTNYPFKKDSLFVVFPFYKTEEQNKISFGIRDSETSKEIDKKILVKGENRDLMPISGKGFELKLKQFELYNYLKIYNLELERNIILNI